MVLHREEREVTFRPDMVSRKALAAGFGRKNHQFFTGG